MSIIACRAIFFIINIILGIKGRSQLSLPDVRRSKRPASRQLYSDTNVSTITHAFFTEKYELAKNKFFSKSFCPECPEYLELP